jgi:glycosyltransferase involved in cell wall biosynthesis
MSGETRDDAPRFSVIIPTYGRPAFLDEAVSSVLDQTFADFECIVVDDASETPPSLPDDPRLKLLRRNVNAGPAAARNTGMAAATGQILAFLDDDDVWQAGRLSAADAGHARAPVVVCWQGTLGQASEHSGRVLEGSVGDTVLDEITPHLGATSIERRIAPRFDERYDASEDVEWWLRAAQLGPVATVREVGLLYRVHSGTRTRTSMGSRMRGARLLLEQHDDWFRTHPRARAFRLKRMGLGALRDNDRRAARHCFAASMRLRPDPKTAWHLVRAIGPSRTSADE